MTITCHLVKNNRHPNCHSLKILIGQPISSCSIDHCLHPFGTTDFIFTSIFCIDRISWKLNNFALSTENTIDIRWYLAIPDPVNTKHHIRYNLIYYLTYKGYYCYRDSIIRNCFNHDGVMRIGNVLLDSSQGNSDIRSLEGTVRRVCWSPISSDFELWFCNFSILFHTDTVLLVNILFRMAWIPGS